MVEMKEKTANSLNSNLTNNEVSRVLTKKYVNNNQPIKPSKIQNKTHVEKGGPSGLEPTRYGDWERGGRCIDF